MKNKVQFLMIIIIASLSFSSVSYSAGSFYLGYTLVEGFKEYEKEADSERDADYQLGSRYMGYVAGVYDATNYLYDADDSVQLGQLCSIVGKYLKDHPKKCDKLDSELIVEALKEAFPKQM